MKISQLILLVILIPALVIGEKLNHKSIEMAFFKCEKSKNLEGGIYGKGPFKKFGLEKSECFESEWVKIDKNEFKELAIEWYNYDWSGDISWWQN